MKKSILISGLSALVLSVVGCAPGSNFQQLSSGILGSTGYVSGSQVDAVFKAGGKFAKAAEGLTDEQEYFLGRGVSAMVFSKYRRLPQDQLNLYVNKVGRVVASYSERPETFGGYHFLVLESSEINALSAPSGFVFITRGLLKILPDEDALAAVLAHEVAHVVKGHGVRAISRANLTEGLLIVGKEAAASQGGEAVQLLSNAFGDSITDVFNTVLTSGYSRSQEYEADEYAVELLKRSGYNPGAMQVVLNALKNVEATSTGGLFATHPSPERRISNLDKVEPLAPDAAKAQIVRTARFKKNVGV